MLVTYSDILLYYIQCISCHWPSY